jgi:soluble lytic murein transglycosylase-like protein
VRALRLLYAAEQPQHTIAFYNDIASRADQSTVLLLAAVAYENRDARGMVLVGKAAYDRGILIDTIAFPVFGIPEIPKDDPQADRALIYAIARQESQFVQSATSHASAHGLMQVIPATARAIARRLGIPYDVNKLRGDPVYNARLGANELGHLLQQFNGSYILAFVGYNAGPGRAREWIAIRRSARSQGRRHRLGRARPLLRDALLHPARDGEYAGLSRAVRRQARLPHRGRPRLRAGVNAPRPARQIPFFKQPNAFSRRINARSFD